ncbi:MAG TPA: hypothetical protein VN973_03900 [Candidatus Dormibacteraeota bacterium]|nr:hypothetical protein [Candidatus Dormibacteraeota bacterium]
MTFPVVLKRSVARLMTVGLLSAVATGFVPAAASANDHHDNGNGCRLSGDSGIKHVIYIQFDNTHFTRDNPNVPSDLEQMPNLLNFIRNNGTLDTNHHTPLISHTATDILTSLTGVYGDRHGVPVSNTFRYFNPDGTSNLGVSFAYWTSPVFDPTTTSPSDTKPNMLTAAGKNAPAPWVPFTRAGCNVGSVATANTILENIGIDVPTVFPPDPVTHEPSPEMKEAADPAGNAFADFVGIGIHCATANAVCAGTNGRPDRLPDEPGGYNGFKALFGHKYVAQQVGGISDINGSAISGFPGFDGMSAAVSLGYVASMQEHGVPVTYAYISDAHDKHPTGPAYGPGEAGYRAALTAYDTAFGKFFTRLASDGINKSNTLFVFTADEGDHFGGGTPTPAGCNGVTIPCNYSRVICTATNPPSCLSNNIGETNANFAGLLKTQQGIGTPFKVHSDSAPTVYITGNPSRVDPVTRTFEQAAGVFVGMNPQTGNSEQIMTAMADPVEMKLLHMVTADPARTPTFTYFARPEYFLFAAAPNCDSPCITQNPGFAWNHGDFQPEIVTTWLGMVGPGVRKLGTTNAIWSDHTDIRPTMLALTGLRDDYASDGRVLVEALKSDGLAESLHGNRDIFVQLAKAYKQINAPVGQLGLLTLARSTQALQGNAATYATIEGQLTALNNQRDAIAVQMIAILNAAAFNGKAINERHARDLIQQAENLLGQGDQQQGDQQQGG